MGLPKAISNLQANGERAVKNCPGSGLLWATYLRISVRLFAPCSSSSLVLTCDDRKNCNSVRMRLNSFSSAQWPLVNSTDSWRSSSRSTKLERISIVGKSTVFVRSPSPCRMRSTDWSCVTQWSILMRLIRR